MGCAAQQGGGATAPSAVRSGDSGLTITKPAQAADVRGPVEVCLAIKGYTVEPAKNGVNEGKGHHHLLVDTAVPSDLSQPVAKDASHIHMGDGSSCKTLNLSPGVHTIRGLFAKGHHVPYDPPITDAIMVMVKWQARKTN